MDNKQRMFHRLASGIIAVGVIAILAVCIVKFTPSSKRMGADEYFGTLGKNEAAIVLEDQVVSERALIQDGNVYIDYTLVQSQLNSRFHWDASVGMLLFTTAEQIYEIAPDQSAYTVDGESFDAGYTILMTTPSGMFLSANFLQQFSNLKCEVYDTPSRVVITRGSRSVTMATVRRRSKVRFLGGIKSPILTEVSEGAQVQVLMQMEKWSEVRTLDGYIGYIQNKALRDVTETETETFYESAPYTSIHLESRVNLVWHQIDYAEMNNNLEEDISAMTGVNVISPTWYYLADSAGGVGSYADASYVERAHGAGLQVWALINNFGSGEEISTTAVLASREARQRVQNYLVNQAVELGFDGINIDFEGIAQEAGYDYVQFIRELSILCRKNQIILSVDVPVPMEFSRHYNRGELAAVCDYVIMMGYDEHYYGSETAGSVASMDFEISGIENMLTEMSPDKLISGIPFYSRVWYTGSEGVSSETITMEGARQLLADLGITPVFDESTGQQYAQWTAEDGRLCEIWLEDDSSVASRAALVSQYNLGGVAAWVLGNETDSVWAIISEAIV